MRIQAREGWTLPPGVSIKTYYADAAGDAERAALQSFALQKGTVPASSSYLTATATEAKNDSSPPETECQKTQNNEKKDDLHPHRWRLGTLRQILKTKSPRMKLQYEFASDTVEALLAGYVCSWSMD